jgi:transcriptional regulator with XRE-family HTH domain
MIFSQKEKPVPTIQVRRFRDVGAVARAVRESRGITQEALAKNLNVTRDYLRALEKGTPTLYTSRLFRALDVLGIKLAITYELGDVDG